MAEKPCNTCAHFDPIIKGKDLVTRHGRCAIQSTYPAKEQAGQSFPVGVKRAAPGELAKPLIVVGADVVRHCTLYRAKR